MGIFSPDENGWITEDKYTELNKENKQLKEELQELRQVRKDLPDIQEPYVILYRQIKKELHNAENKLSDIYLFCNKPDRCGNVCANDILHIIEGKKNE